MDGLIRELAQSFSVGATSRPKLHIDDGNLTGMCISSVYNVRIAPFAERIALFGVGDAA